jgi:hypothetical protein
MSGTSRSSGMTSDRESLRALVLAPIGRDAVAAADLLQRAGVATEICRSVCELAEGIAAGAATALVAEEALFGHDLAPLTQWVY